MYLQRSARFRDEIQIGGCAIVAAAYQLNQYLGIENTPEDLNDMFDDMVDDGTIDGEAFVNRWEDLMFHLGVDVEYFGHSPIQQTIDPRSGFELLYWEKRRAGGPITHFTAGDGFGRTTYDPWGYGSIASLGKGGVLMSKRIFRYK